MFFSDLLFLAGILFDVEHCRDARFSFEFSDRKRRDQFLALKDANASVSFGDTELHVGAHEQSAELGGTHARNVADLEGFGGAWWGQMLRADG